MAAPNPEIEPCEYAMLGERKLATRTRAAIHAFEPDFDLAINTTGT
jgi:hypothetical protein